MERNWRTRNWKYPNLWRGCTGAWCPSVTGPTGGWLVDGSGRGKTVTILTRHNPATDWVRSGGKWALKFDAADTDYIPMKGSFVAGSFTCSLWISFPNLTGTVKGIVSSQTNSPYTTPYTLLQRNNSDLRLYNVTPGYATLQAVAADTWYHVLWTHTGTKENAWVNGSRKMTDRTVSTAGTTNNGFFLGLGYNAYIDAKIDDVRLYNRPLTGSEAVQLYQLGRGGAYEKKFSTYSYATPATRVGAIVKSGWKYPNLWRGCVGAWCPTISGPQKKMRDWSGNGYDATYGGTMMVSPGKKGKYGIYSDGSASQYMTVGNTSNSTDKLQMHATPFSFSVWVNRNNGALASLEIVERYQGSVRQYVWGTVGTTMYAWISNNTGSQYAGRTVSSVGSYVAATGWHHLVWTNDGTKTTGGNKIYIDGVQRDNGNFAAGTVTPQASSGVVTFSQNQGGTTGPGILILDDVRAYRRVLLHSEVQQLYQLGRGGAYEKKFSTYSVEYTEAAVGGVFDPAVWSRRRYFNLPVYNR